MSIVKIKTSKGDNVEIQIDSFDMKVQALKDKIAEQMSIPANEQRLIYSGHVLKDERALSEYGIQHEHVIHLVRAASKSTPPPQSAKPTIAAPAAPAPQAPMAGLGGLGGMGLPPGMTPEMMEQMMQSPMMDQIFDNPELLQQMFMANPQFQEIQRRNPEMAAIFRDPVIMRRTLNAMRNPRLMQEMMRNADTAMSRIEMMPGGFQHLQRFYNEVQEPLLEGATEQARSAAANPANPFASLFGGGAAPTTGQDQQAQQPPVEQPSAPASTPFRNPWGGTNATPGGSPQAGAGTGGAAPNPFASLFGAGTGGTGMNPFASMFGGAGQGTGGAGLPGMPPGMDLNSAMQMMNNPAIQTMMEQVLSNPTLFNQMMQMNPMIRQMGPNNPFLQNPEGMRQLMLSSIQMQRSMRSLFGGGDGTSGAAPQGTGAAPDLSSLLGMFGGAPQQGQTQGQDQPAQSPPTSGVAGTAPAIDLASILGSLGVPPQTGSGSGAPAATPPADFSGLLSALAGARGAGSPAAPQNATPPAVRYARELEQLHEMGLLDDAANIRALQAANGSVQIAIERLFAQQQQ